MKQTDKRLLIIEDEPALLEKFKNHGETVFNHVLTAYDCIQAKAILLNNKIDCIVTDIHLPDGSGFALLKEMQITDREIPIIVVTGFADKELVIDFLNSKVFYFFEKPFNKDKFIAILSKAYNYLEKRYAGDLSALTEAKVLQLKAVYKISSREMEVISCSLQNYTNDRIAKNLFISPFTVKKHLSNIFLKLDIASKNDLREKIITMK